MVQDTVPMLLGLLASVEKVAAVVVPVVAAAADAVAYFVVHFVAVAA